MRETSDLIKAIGAGKHFKYLLFWGHRADPSGLGPGCLSQWWPAVFEIDGVRYASAEHYMMAEKARLFEDEAIRKQVLASASPAQAKKLGRKVRGFDETIWRAHRFEIVCCASVAKFSSDPKLRRYLLNTGRKVLVEASPRDRIWGIGMGAKHEHARTPSKWRGLNLLGFALMTAREVMS